MTGETRHIDLFGPKIRSIVAAILLTISACAIPTSGSNPYRIEIPARPEIEAAPALVPHGTGAICVWSDGSVGDCVILYTDDFARIGRYLGQLERELKAACLALGGSDEECKTKNLTASRPQGSWRSAPL